VQLIAGFNFLGRINMTALFFSLSKQEEFFPSVFTQYSTPFSQRPHHVWNWALYCTEFWCELWCSRFGLGFSVLVTLLMAHGSGCSFAVRSRAGGSRVDLMWDSREVPTMVTLIS